MRLARVLPPYPIILITVPDYILQFARCLGELASILTVGIQGPGPTLQTRRAISAMVEASSTLDASRIRD